MYSLFLPGWPDLTHRYSQDSADNKLDIARERVYIPASRNRTQSRTNRQDIFIGLVNAQEYNAKSFR